MPTIHTALRALSFGLLLAALAWLVWKHPDDLAAIPAHLARLPARVWLGVLALALMSYLLRFLRWHLMLTHLGHHVPLRRQAVIYLAGFGLAMTPGKLGETVRSAYLAPLGVPVGHSLAAFFCERLIDLLVVGVLASLAMAHLLGDPLWFALALACVMGTVLLLRSRLMPLLASRQGQGMLARITDDGANALHRLLRGRVLWASFGLGLLAWAGQGLGLWLALSASGLSQPVGQTIGSYALSLLAGALSFIPGGLGATEATLMLLLERQGVAVAEAASAALVSRGLPLWTGVLVGLLALLWLGSQRKDPAVAQP